MSEEGAVAPLPAVTRLVVVTDDGVKLDAYNLYKGGVDLLIQDDGKTLKIFPKRGVEQ